MSDNNFELAVLRAEWLHDSGELQHALDAWTECVSGWPEAWEARVGRARTYLLLDQPAAAAIDLRRALDAAPESREVRQLLELCQARVGRSTAPRPEPPTNGATREPAPIPPVLPDLSAPEPVAAPVAAPPVLLSPLEPVPAAVAAPPVPLSPPRLGPDEVPTLASVAGQVDLVAEVREVLSAWQQRRSKGVWGLGLIGPLGTGRRFLSQCIAGELGAEWIEADAATMAFGAVQAVQALVVRIAACRGRMVLFLESPDLVGVSDRALLGMLTHSVRQRDALLIASTYEPWLWDAPLRRTLGLQRLLLTPPLDDVARRWFLHDPDPQSPYQAEVDRLVEGTEGFTVDDLRLLMGAAFPFAEGDISIENYLEDRQYTLTPPYLLRRLPEMVASGRRWTRQALKERTDEKLPALSDPLHALADRFGV